MTEPVRLLPRSLFGWALVSALFAGLAVAPAFVSMFYVELGTSAMIAAMLALSLQLLVGATGLVSLGHGAFYGLAAYVVFLMTPKDQPLAMWQTLPVAMAVAGIAAFVVGLFALRTKGFFFLMVTLAFGQMIFFIFHDTKIGGGTDGAYLAKPLISALGYEWQLPRKQRALGPYYVALVQLVAMYAALALIVRSLFGRVLEGIRVNEHRMQAMGFNTQRYKLAAFTLAGVLAGAAGHMWAMHTGFVNPEITSWHKSAEALLMILLGGLGSLAGPIVGAIAYTALGEIAQLITERKLLVEGVVILAAVILMRDGITGIKWRRTAARPYGDDSGQTFQEDSSALRTPQVTSPEVSGHE
jgi:branched-chain amino acid transport system permease protein